MSYQYQKAYRNIYDTRYQLQKVQIEETILIRSVKSWIDIDLI